LWFSVTTESAGNTVVSTVRVIIPTQFICYQIDRAMATFAELLDLDQDYLPAILGMATGFMVEKNQVSIPLVHLVVVIIVLHSTVSFQA
jgi:hypothetical protein